MLARVAEMRVNKTVTGCLSVRRDETKDMYIRSIMIMIGSINVPEV